MQLRAGDLMDAVPKQTQTAALSSLEWARGQRGISQSAKLVLIVLAAYHVDENGFGRPTLRAVARDIERSIDTVRRAVKVLERRQPIKRTFKTSTPVPDLQLMLSSIGSGQSR